MNQLKSLVFALLAISLCSAQNITIITPVLTQTTENRSYEVADLEDVVQWISGLIHNEETHYGESGEHAEHTESAEETILVEEHSVVEDGGSEGVSEGYVLHSEEHLGEEIIMVVEAEEGSFRDTETMTVFMSVEEEVIEPESLGEEKLAIIAVDVEKVLIEKPSQEDQKEDSQPVDEVQKPQGVNTVTIKLEVEGDGHSDIDVDVDVFVQGKEDEEKKDRHSRHQRRERRGMRHGRDESHFRPQMRN